MKRACNRMIIAGLAALAGSAFPAAAQHDDKAAEKPRQSETKGTRPEAKNRDSRDDKREMAGAVRYRTGKWLMGKSVVGADGKEIAEVEDFIIDRGSGKVEYVVLDTNKRAGAEGRTVTVPFRAVRCDKDGTHTLAADFANLSSMATFDAKEWKEGSPARSVRSALDRKLEEQCVDAVTDPYAGRVNKVAQKTHVEGVVTKVERMNSARYGEQVVVTVKQSDGSEKAVALGPSWFVNSAAVTPMRDDKIVLDTYEISGEKAHVASGLRLNGQEVTLRDSEGKSVWSPRGDGKGGTARARYTLASSLNGAAIECRGGKCGRVDDIVVETGSGHVAFLSIDPDENFLGIGDTNRMVPWSVVTVSPQRVVRIDASKDMILASAETPKDFTTLPDAERFATVHRAYRMDTPAYENWGPPGNPSAPTAAQREAWGPKGVMLRTAERTMSKKLTGTCEGQSTVTINQAVGDARILKLKTDGSVREIVIGPSWYVGQEKIPCGDGATLVVHAAPTTVDGKEYWVARTISVRNNDIALIDDSGTPAWSR